MSRFRARCPDCRTLTAVAMGAEYECHVCGRQFAAGLVRVPRAWGEGGEAMAEAAELPLPYPEVAVVEEDTLAGQTLAVASELPDRPIVLGGCCCAHVGAIEGLAARVHRLAVVWLDAHGDLNTPETSPSGNAWGMPLRMAIDSGAVAPDDVALVGARSLDPPEQEFAERAGIHRDDVRAALDGADAVYVALDFDVLDPAAAAPFMPEPAGLTPEQVDDVLAAASPKLSGVGLTGMRPDPVNADLAVRFLARLGL